MMNIQCRFLMDLVIIIYIHPILPQQFIQVHLSHYSRLGQVQIDLHSSYPDSCPSSSIGTSFSLFQVRLGLDRFTFILSCPSSSYKYIFLTIPGQVRFRQIHIHPILPQQFIQVYLAHYSRFGQVKINLHSSYPAPVVHIGTFFSLFQVRLGLYRFTFILSCPSSSYRYILLTIQGQVRFRQIYIHPILPQQFIQVYFAHYSRLGQEIYIHPILPQ